MWQRVLVRASCPSLAQSPRSPPAMWLCSVPGGTSLRLALEQASDSNGCWCRCLQYTTPMQEALSMEDTTAHVCKPGLRKGAMDCPSGGGAFTDRPGTSFHGVLWDTARRKDAGRDGFIRRVRPCQCRYLRARIKANEGEPAVFSWRFGGGASQYGLRLRGGRPPRPFRLPREHWRIVCQAHQRSGSLRTLPLYLCGRYRVPRAGGRVTQT